MELPEASGNNIVQCLHLLKGLPIWFKTNNKISLDHEKTKSVLNFLETLEDDDDVQYVYANLDVDNKLTTKASVTWLLLA